jgi:2-C-methyl-D-erythritol 4-phosphate cytidylyltransferase
MGESLPKQYLRVQGATLLEHSLRSLLADSRISHVAVALHPQDEHAASVALLDDARVTRTVGADQRAGSVLAGLLALEELAAERDWVLVHDAARPCLRRDELSRLIDQVMQSGVGGLLAEPVVDTVKRADRDGRVEGTLDRTGLWRAQTPQMFRYGELVAALRQAQDSASAITDEASAMELAGHPVQIVEGVSSNLKVTVPDDLALAGWYLARQ